MDDIRALGVILKVFDYKENDKLAHILTPDLGRISAIFRGVKKQNAKLKPFAQPLSFCEFLLIKRGELYIVTSCALVDNFYVLSESTDKFFTACALLEACEILTDENLSDGGIMTQLLRALKELAYSQTDHKNIAAKFILSAFTLCGYKLNLSACAVCKTPLSKAFYFDPKSGGAICGMCGSDTFKQISMVTLNYMRFLQDTPYEKLHTLKIPQNEINIILSVLFWTFEELFGTKLKTAKNLTVL